MSYRVLWNHGRTRLSWPGRWLKLTATVIALVSAHPAFAIVFLSSSAQDAGAGAGQSVLDPEAKLIISLSDGSTDGCSGSLVGNGGYVLTAAHCVTGDTDTASATNISINFANVGISLATTSYLVDPAWNGSLTNGGDLALIQLSKPVTSISSYVLDTAASAVGDVVTLTGYGDTGYGGSGYSNNTFGTLYYGQNLYIGTYEQVPSVYGFSFASEGPSYVGADEAMIAPGDSGGAELADIGGTWEIVGVNDFISCDTTGCTPNSSLGQEGGGTSVYANQAWLDSVLVPEPASILLVAMGLLGLAAISRRRGSAWASAMGDRT